MFYVLSTDLTETIFKFCRYPLENELLLNINYKLSWQKSKML